MRHIRFALLLAFAALFSGAALAQSNYPNRPVHIVVGFGAGSAADLTARVVGNRLSETMGQRFLVGNRPGGGSTVAAEQVVRGAKDGYTIYLGTVANVINGVLQPNLSFDFAKDFTPVVLATSSPLVLVVHPSTGVTSVADLIKLAKAKPGDVFFASSGVGTAPHLSGELFNMSAGIKMVHVPYQGSAQAVTDLLAGRTQAMFSPISTVLAHVKSGQLKALATTELKRSSELPDLPTVSEAGVKDFNTSLWLGFVAPTGTPADVVQKLADEINKALKNPETAEALRKTGLEIDGGSPANFATFIAAETKKWDAVVAAAGLRK
jgi:tripartite-type tricarboxylate transporter receptor subunit TctC